MVASALGGVIGTVDPVGGAGDALAVGLVTTCAMMLSLGRREVVYRFGQLTTICGGSMTSSSSFVGVVVARPLAPLSFVR